MRKLKLDVANLEVTSFDTDRTATVRGTVAAHKTAPLTGPYATCLETCAGGMDTCGNSCGGGGTCWGDVCSYGTPSNCAACYTGSCGMTICCVPID